MIHKHFENGEGIPNRARPVRAVSGASHMGPQPAQGGAYHESANELGNPHMMTWRDEGRVLTMKGVNLVSTRVEDGAMKARKEETRVQTAGGYACGTRMDDA